MRDVAAKITGVSRIVDTEDPTGVIPPDATMRIEVLAFLVIQLIQRLHRLDA